MSCSECVRDLLPPITGPPPRANASYPHNPGPLRIGVAPEWAIGPTKGSDRGSGRIADVVQPRGVIVGESIFATLHTNVGPIRLELFPNHAPKTVANFVGLAEGTKEYV